jgi:hypothetical protein
MKSHTCLRAFCWGQCFQWWLSAYRMSPASGKIFLKRVVEK